VSVLVIAQLSLEVPEGLMNYPVYNVSTINAWCHCWTVLAVETRKTTVV
jgi:hypothetical protein